MAGNRPRKRPTHRLKVLNKATDQKAEVGAGWQNPDGTITIALNQCVVLTPDPNLLFTLFPVDRLREGEDEK